jgi:hypothetical protein
MKLLVTLPLIASIICFQASAINDNTNATIKTNKQSIYILKSQPSSNEIIYGLDSYFEDMDEFIRDRFNRQSTVSEKIFVETIMEGDNAHFVQLPLVLQIALDKNHNIRERLKLCMLRYTD